jgi:hypothetical protein
MKNLLKPSALILTASLALAAVLSLVFPAPSFAASCAAYAILFFISGISLFFAWKWAGSKRSLGWIMLIAFLLPVLLGAALRILLPLYGYDNQIQDAGYVFNDAMRRDIKAKELAWSGESILNAFGGDYGSDQYGGLLAFSALVYRLLSMDFHRPLLITILAAFVFALGIPFLWQAISKRWDERHALIACWIAALYPDVLLLASSQMREPFLIGFGSIALWAALTWREAPKKRILPLLVSLAGFAVLSTRLVIPFAVFIAGLILVDNLSLTFRSKYFKLILLFIFLVIAGIALLNLKWLEVSAAWDITVAMDNAPWIQDILTSVGEGYKVPILVTYGLMQPVLPAALTDSALPLWKTIAIVRSLGWYSLIPFLLYSIFAVWKSQPEKNRKILIWVMLFTLAWLVLSSARAAGDLWDNPRYRAVFIPELGLLAGWTYLNARLNRDPWLWRWVTVTGIFVLLFLNWYCYRNFQFGIPLSFVLTLAGIVLLSGAVLVGGWLWDRRHKALPPQDKEI